MRNRKTVLEGLTILISLTLLLQSVSLAQSTPPINTLISYMIIDKESPIEGDNITITMYFKNYLNIDHPIRNISTAITPGLNIENEKGLNITNVFDAPFEDPNYNKTELFLTGTDSTPMILWNHTYIEIAWALFEVNVTQSIWFNIHCYLRGSYPIANPIYTYYLDLLDGGDGKAKSYTGSGLQIDVGVELNTSAIPSPLRGDWEWQWWFVGALLLTAPVIIIVITRITLWKR
ncbi:MAG: hypothetical protein JXA54_08645 [Candidatus Heimdallarchaeota archaeon]|nr:hypothetical protein [Candidatus Heimdallarchaeota archaeon]